MSAIAVEAQQTREIFGRVETLEAVTASFPDGDPRRLALLGVIEAELASAPPVRPVVAAQILELNEKTVRDWATEGALSISQHRPRLLLDAGRVHEVSHLVADLR